MSGALERLIEALDRNTAALGGRSPNVRPEDVKVTKAADAVKPAKDTGKPGRSTKVTIEAVTDVAKNFLIEAQDDPEMMAARKEGLAKVLKKLGQKKLSDVSPGDASKAMDLIKELIATFAEDDGDDSAEDGGEELF